VEEGSLAGGMSSAVLEYWTDKGVLCGQKIKRLGIPDCFVEHGAQKELRRIVGIGKQGIKNACLEMIG
jgi:1-deoxy-D-xylulose-5-phosphate synthase